MASDSIDSARTVTVETGCRIHFGLFSFGRASGRLYGGIGLMLREPSIRLRVQAAAEFEADRWARDRIERAAQCWREHRQQDSLPGCSISVVESVPQHIGLGSGTQLASAVATGLSAWQGERIDTAEELAQASGRGGRSAVGTHGFLRGGILFDDGKTDNEPVGKLKRRISFPAAWRMLLIWPEDKSPIQTMSGPAEVAAFREMPAVSPGREGELREIADHEIAPAAESADYDRFAEALFRYNHLAGQCYRDYQHGAYASPQVESVIETCRSLGIEGVGQSSWGPLVFVIAPTEKSALVWEQLVSKRLENLPLQTLVTQGLNEPARIVDTRIDS